MTEYTYVITNWQEYGLYRGNEFITYKHGEQLTIVDLYDAISSYPEDDAFSLNILELFDNFDSIIVEDWVWPDDIKDLTSNDDFE